MVNSNFFSSCFCVLICFSLVFRQTFVVTYINILVLLFSLLSFYYFHSQVRSLLETSRMLMAVVLFLLFLLVELVSASFSILPLESLKTVFREFLFLIMFLGFISGLSLNYNNLTFFIKCIKISILFVVLSIIVEFVYLIYINEYITGLRLSGIYGNASAPGHFLAIAMPLVAGYSLAEKAPKKFTFILIALTLVALLLTMSRSGIVAFVISMVFILSRDIIKTALLIVIFSGGVLITYLTLPESLLSDISLVFRIGNGFSGRDALWEVGRDVVDGNSLIGVGPSLFKYYFLDVNQPLSTVEYVHQIVENYASRGDLSGYSNSVFGGIIGNSTHNIFFDVLVTSGFFGLFFFLAFIFSILFTSVSIYKLTNGDLLVKSSISVLLSLLFRLNFEPNGVLKGGVSENFALWFVLFLPFLIYYYRINYKNV